MLDCVRVINFRIIIIIIIINLKKINTPGSKKTRG